MNTNTRPARNAVALFCGLVTLLLAARACAQIAVQDGFTNIISAVTTVSTNFTVTAGANVLVVSLNEGQNGTATPAILSWGSQTISSAVSENLFNRGSAIYYLFNPTPGTNIISATISGNSFDMQVFTLNGVNTTVAPLVSANSTAANVTTLSCINTGIPTNAFAVVNGLLSNTGQNLLLTASSGTVVAAYTIAQVNSEVAMGYVTNLNSESGTFTLTDTSSGSKMNILTAIFTPAPLPPAISIQPQNATVNTNNPGPVIFSVTAVGALPLSYQWFTNGTVALSDNANRTGSTSNTLTIPIATAADFGKYSVVVTNLYGAATSSVAMLDSMVPAVVIIAPATDIESQSAVLNGQTLSTGGSVPAVTFFYGPADGGTNPSAWSQSVSLGAQNGSFSAGIAGLTPVTTYFFTVMATNATGISWSASSGSFTTTLDSSPLTSYVNCFIGTVTNLNDKIGTWSIGNVFPGADYPRGMLQFSPDTSSSYHGSPYAGAYFYPDTLIKGFSVRHFSGRGLTCYNDFEFKPLLGVVTASPQTNNNFYWSGFSHANESASPGYYSVLLNNGVQVELSASLRTGMAKFTFPSTNAATVLIDAGSSINGTTANTSITIVGTNQIQGQATSNIGGGPQLYTIYFAAQFDHGFNSPGTWNGGTVSPGTLSKTGDQVGAFVTFDATVNPVVYAKVGISFVSISNAVANLNAENPSGNFVAVQNAASNAWNNVLNKIVVSGGTTAQMQTFYTALYHCFFHPNVFNDANGQYMGMDFQVHTVASGHSQYENIPGWDIPRSDIPLTALLSPDVASDIAQSLVNWAQQGGGGMPRWEQCNRNSGGEVGDGPSIIVAAAYALGATNFDTALALGAMKYSATNPAATSDGNLCREQLSNYINLGYVPDDVSSTLEYCAADLSLYQFSQALGNTDPGDVNYLIRSGNWQNLFNPTNDLIQRRDTNGMFTANETASATIGYTEGTAIQYTWMVPFNLNGLFYDLGGKSNVVSIMNNYYQQLNAGPNSIYEWVGDEPCECDPWEYDFTGQPSGTQYVNRQIQTLWFTNTPGGFPGNDDAGAISSWYVFSALGFFPEIPSAGGFVIGSPMFPNVTINLENGRQINLQANNESAQNCYVQNLTINGTNSTSLWLPFSTLRNGANLVFTLGGSPSSWGTGTNDVPPSFANTVSTPFITTQPQPVSVYPGQTAVFSVTVAGAAPLTYQWFTNGTVALSDDADRVGSISNILTIQNPTANDAGNYTVLITNGYGSVTSSVATLTILTPKLTNFTLISGGAPINQGVGSDWNTVNNWSPGGQAASVTAYPSNTYEVVVGSRLRTPAGTASNIFPGIQLTIDGSGVFENGTLNTVGELRFKNNSSPSTNYFDDLVLNGGELDDGDNTLVDIQGQLNVSGNSAIYVDTSAGNDRGYQIDAWLTGSGNVFWHEFSGGLGGTNLQITCPSNTFKGQWIVDQGALVGVGANSLGTNNIIVGKNGLTAAVETLYNINNTNGSLIFGANGKMFLHQDDHFASVIVNGTSLANGTYPFDMLTHAYPANFPAAWTQQFGSTFTTGSGQLIVGSITPSSPHITSVSLSGTSVSISAANGSVGGSWILLQSADVALPLSQWQTNRAGNFDGGGYLSTNIANIATNSQEFYIFKVH